MPNRNPLGALTWALVAAMIAVAWLAGTIAHVSHHHASTERLEATR